MMIVIFIKIKIHYFLNFSNFFYYTYKIFLNNLYLFYNKLFIDVLCVKKKNLIY